MASAFGILIGSMLKDSNALMATFKSMGLLLYAPALVELFHAFPTGWHGYFLATTS
ncbi:MAG UNVERIFIED_CONTAM: hypothetical protein LVT10_15355 [Anaerolineae bacterium]